MEMLGMCRIFFFLPGLDQLPMFIRIILMRLHEAVHRKRPEYGFKT